MNEPVPLDRPTASDHYEHEVRIARLEVAVENLASIAKSLREQMNEGFKSQTALIHDVEQRLRAEIQRLDDRIDRLDDKIERLNARIDLMNRWAIGLFITYLFGTVSLLARPYFGI